ncbi:MAG: hypothetical protein J7L45_00845 [Candidatus Aenigmarchaeota archaeon]|nr:hypothetical protein [Candidatus Aenigmarchaeota archaeon]
MNKVSPEDVIDILINEYKGMVEKTNPEEVEEVKKFIEGNFSIISNNNDCKELNMILKGKQTGRTFSLGTLYDEGGEVKLETSDETYVMNKDDLRNYQLDKNQDVEEKKYTWTKMLRVSKEARPFIRNLYEKIKQKE